MNHLELLSLDHLKVEFLIVSKFDEVGQKLFLSNWIVLVEEDRPGADMEDAVLQKLRTLSCKYGAIVDECWYAQALEMLLLVVDMEQIEPLVGHVRLAQRQTQRVGQGWAALFFHDRWLDYWRSHQGLN